MRVSRLSAMVLSAVFSAAVAFAQDAVKTPAANTVGRQLMANEQKVLEALKKKDAATFASLVVADSWSVDEMGYTKTTDLIKGLADLKIDSITASEMKVLPMSATVSLVTYRMDQKGSFQGQPFPPVVYATTVWVNQSGTWHAMFHQESTAVLKK